MSDTSNHCSGVAEPSPVPELAQGGETALTVSETPSTVIEPLSTTSGAKLSGQRDPHHLPLLAGAHLDHRAGAVDVPLHDVAAEPRVRGERALEVDGCAGGDAGEARHIERLPHHVGGEPVGALVDDGQADPAHRDRVALRGIRDDERTAHRHAHAVAGGFDGRDLAAFFDDSGEHVSPSLSGSLSRRMPAGR